MKRKLNGRMNRKVKWALSISSFMFIFTFQNCSVHKSSGRKYVESGQAKSARDSQTTSAVPNGKLSSGCLPYITDKEASQAMGAPTTAKLVYDLSNKSVSCVVSTDDPSSEPSLDVAACSVSADNIKLLQDVPDQTMVLDPLGPLSGGSLGFSRTRNNGEVQFVFVAASGSAMEGVACTFEFASEAEYLRLSSLVIDRAAALVHFIHPNLR